MAKAHINHCPRERKTWILEPICFYYFPSNQSYHSYATATAISAENTVLLLLVSTTTVDNTSIQSLHHRFYYICVVYLTTQQVSQDFYAHTWKASTLCMSEEGQRGPRSELWMYTCHKFGSWGTFKIIYKYLKIVSVTFPFYLYYYFYQVLCQLPSSFYLLKIRRLHVFLASIYVQPVKHDVHGALVVMF